MADRSKQSVNRSVGALQTNGVPQKGPLVSIIKLQVVHRAARGSCSYSEVPQGAGSREQGAENREA